MRISRHTYLHTICPHYYICVLNLRRHGISYRIRNAYNEWNGKVSDR